MGSWREDDGSYKREWLLNKATNRWCLNYKREVGPTSQSIRECKPDSVEEWEEYYYDQIKEEEDIEELGEKLYNEIKSEIKKEVDNISEEECIDYMKNLVIDRVWEGYNREITIIEELIEKKIDYDLKPSSDEWDREYNVDYYIEINDSYIGIQIKPKDIGTVDPTYVEQEEMMMDSHEEFEDEYGGKVFIVNSEQTGSATKKDYKIQNDEIIDEIKEEISRLENNDE